MFFARFYKTCCQKGVAILEFTIVLPLLLLLLFGMLEYAHMVNQYLVVTRLAYEGARYSATVAGLHPDLETTYNDNAESDSELVKCKIDIRRVTETVGKCGSFYQNVDTACAIDLQAPSCVLHQRIKALFDSQSTYRNFQVNHLRISTCLSRNSYYPCQTEPNMVSVDVSVQYRPFLFSQIALPLVGGINVQGIRLNVRATGPYIM